MYKSKSKAKAEGRVSSGSKGTKEECQVTLEQTAEVTNETSDSGRVWQWKITLEDWLVLHWCKVTCRSCTVHIICPHMVTNKTYN